MHIAFKFHYIHNNGLFTRLLERIKEKSPLNIVVYKEQTYYFIEASGEQGELETLAELVSSMIPQSLFLFEYHIEEIESINETGSLSKEESFYEIPYCAECQDQLMQTLDPFVSCNICGFSEKDLSLEALSAFVNIDNKNAQALFEELADILIETGRLTLPTYNGTRTFTLLSEKEEEHNGILICDPSELSASFVITQDELNTLMMIEKPSLRLKPKLKFRAVNDLTRAFYPVFFADDKITLALSLALSKKGIFALYCDQLTSLRAASALQEHVIIEAGRDMFPWEHPMKTENASCCDFEDFTALSNDKGLFLNRAFKPSQACISFISKEAGPPKKKGISFEPSHAALRSVVVEHDLQNRSLCSVYLSRQHDSQICCFSSKIGYTSLAEFSYEIFNEPIKMLESISQMDDEANRLITNYKTAHPALYEKIENAHFTTDKNASMLTRLWAMAALFLGLSEGGDIHKACEELEATALEFNGKSGPRIDYKVAKSDKGYQVDPRLAIRSAISFKLAGVDEYLLSFGFIDSLADFIAQQAELADANIAIEGATLNGSLFENRQLLMRTYNALSPNYTIYRNRTLALDGANIAIGAITLGSE